MEMADLNSVLGEVIAAESGYEREINTALQAGSIQVKMHPLSIKRAVANMVVNAARYGNGWIKVSSGTESHRAWFQVEDDGRALSRSSVNICSSLLCAATAPVAPAEQGWVWRLCSALSITITGCWRLAPASVVDCRFAPGCRCLWLASRGPQKRHKKGRY